MHCRLVVTCMHVSGLGLNLARCKHLKWLLMMNAAGQGDGDIFYMFVERRIVQAVHETLSTGIWRGFIGVNSCAR
jgi:hypothetical protein